MDALIRQFGAHTGTERLGGKSGAQVCRLRFERGTAILKAADMSAEYHFYGQAAPILRAYEIGIPMLLGRAQAGDKYWLALEDIPYPLPRDSWQTDARLMRTLARLHSLPAIPLPPGHFAPEWADALTEQASACFDAALQPRIRQQLDHWRASSLFEPECLISGDPNPGNWGARADGSPVLFDWERFCLATPAIDLGIVIAGLGTPAQFAQVAGVYLRERAAIGCPYHAAGDTLAHEIARAKVWTVAEYLSLYTAGALAHDAVFAFLTARVPAWLDSLSP